MTAPKVQQNYAQKRKETTFFMAYTVGVDSLNKGPAQKELTSKGFRLKIE